jgi:hypothetical protein
MMYYDREQDGIEVEQKRMASLLNPVVGHW